MRRAGALLRAAVGAMRETLGEQFLGMRGETPERVLEALAEGHLLRGEGR